MRVQSTENREICTPISLHNTEGDTIVAETGNQVIAQILRSVVPILADVRSIHVLPTNALWPRE